MQVWNALADPIIDCHERAFRAESLLYRDAQQARIGEEALNFVVRQIRKRDVMRSRDQQTMSFEERPMIEESQRGVILEYDRAGRCFRRDLAEHAAGDRSHGEILPHALIDR